MKTLSRIMAVLAGILIYVSARAAVANYDTDSTYQRLRSAMHESFNNADEERFFVDVRNLEDYLLEKGDMHGYYTQRCNEIVFLMNSQNIVEAYKGARKLSQELQERKLHEEMYMAYNMLGHIYRYCGNKEGAKRNFRRVIKMMEEAGYRESMPPIYMNIVGVLEEEEPEKALALLDTARAIAAEASPERVFDIETRRTLIYYNMGETAKFLQGYKAYKEGEAQGLTSVHGRSVEVYHEAAIGNIDRAVELAREELDEESYGTIANIYKNAGRWQEAYEALQKEHRKNDSIASSVLTNSVEGFREELHLYEVEQTVARARLITLTIIIVLLALLVAALAYIVWSRRRHMRELTVAYEHALESDRMKTTFIQNMSHEVRTPLNIISGFAQVIADPDLTASREERTNIAKMMLTNTRIITKQIDEMLELAVNESKTAVRMEDGVDIVDLLSNQLQENQGLLKQGVRLVFDNQLPSGFVMTTNKEMIRRMVNILLDNAIKYTDEGTITLRAVIEDDNKLVLSVEDTGCGIPTEEANHIFERFVKLDTFKEGLGLGLPLCRMLASRLNGFIIFDQTYAGPGARFVLTLPL